MKHDSSLQRTCFPCSRVQWKWVLHYSQYLTLRMVILGLCAVAQPWKCISWSSRRTVIVLKLLPEAVWNSVVSVATEARRFLLAMCFSSQRSRSVSLCGLPLHGWAGATWQRCQVENTELFSNAILLPMFFNEDCMAVCSILHTCHDRVWLT
jgi:hypothetical protein